MTVRSRPALDSLPAYAPGRTVPGAVKLASNELSFPTLPAVAHAIADAVGTDVRTVPMASDPTVDLDPTSHRTGINRYPDNGASALVEGLSTLLDIDEDRIITGCGSVSLCQQLVLAVAGDGDEVLFGWRSFEAYPIVTQIGGATPVKVPVTGAHELDLPAMAAAVTDRTRLIYLCTPNNPTGTVVHRDALEAFLDQVPDDVLVVIDEAYREFDTDPDSPDGAEVAGRRPNVLALRTLSKAYGLAGLRVGYAVGDPQVIVALRKVAIPFSVNSVAQAAALAALAARADLEPRWQQVIDERARVTAALRGFGYDVPTSQANFVWLPLEDAAAGFAEHCEQHRVIIRAFSHTAGGGARVTIGAPDENDLFLAAAASWER